MNQNAKAGHRAIIDKHASRISHGGQTGRRVPALALTSGGDRDNDTVPILHIVVYDFRRLV